MAAYAVSNDCCRERSVTRADLSESLLEATLVSYREEYRELSEIWRHLDDKAQGTVAIAGIFLAAVFAFVQSMTSLRQSIGTGTLLVGAVLLLVTSIVFAVLSLRVRKVSVAPLGEEFEKLILDILGIEDEQERTARVPNLLRDQIRLWRAVNDDVHKENMNKASLVLKAQLFLFFAIFAVALLVVLVIVGWV